MFFALFAHLLSGALSPMHHLHNQIINGSEAMIYEFPFMALVKTDSFCGSVFLNQKWLLSAAHCFHKKPENVTVYYGSHKIVSENVAKVKRYITHPNFVMQTPYPYDIALIELDNPIVFNNKTIAPISLPANNFQLPKDHKKRIVVVAGWGFQAENGKPHNILQKNTMKVLSDFECIQLLSGYYANDNMCAGFHGVAQGGCYGDSGGPLVYKHYKGNAYHYILIGIVTLGPTPCTHYPGIFTKITFHVDWIKKNMS